MLTTFFSFFVKKTNTRFESTDSDFMDTEAKLFTDSYDSLSVISVHLFQLLLLIDKQIYIHAKHNTYHFNIMIKTMRFLNSYSQMEYKYLQKLLCNNFYI